MVIKSFCNSLWAAIWQQLDRHPYGYLVGLFAFCVALFIVTIPLPRIDGQLIGSDGTYYYSYLPSLWLDHDLDFKNQYDIFLPPDNVKIFPRTPTGKLSNSYAVGPALLWSPFFLLGHGVALALRVLGFSVTSNGTGYIEQAFTLIGSITYGFAGLILIHSACLRFFNNATSTLATILIWTATNVIYYMTAEPSMSHMCSLFAVALFIERWLAWRPQPTIRQWALLGLMGGLVAMVRQPDASYLALPIVEVLIASRTQPKAWLRYYVPAALVFGLGALVVFLPQMIVWKILNGSSFLSGYVSNTPTPFFWFEPKILKVMFSLRHGLFIWHPLLLLATLGWLWLYRRDRSLTVLAGLGLAMQVYIIGSWQAWWQGDAFGGRMFISSLPTLALGICALIEWGIARRALTILWLVSIGLVGWNGLFFIQYRFRYISMLEAITPAELTIGKLWMLQDLLRKLSSVLLR